MWLATASDGADLTGLPRLGVTCGYQLFEANLDAPAGHPRPRASIERPAPSACRPPSK